MVQAAAILVPELHEALNGSCDMRGSVLPSMVCYSTSLHPRPNRSVRHCSTRTLSQSIHKTGVLVSSTQPLCLAADIRGLSTHTATNWRNGMHQYVACHSCITLSGEFTSMLSTRLNADSNTACRGLSVHTVCRKGPTANLKVIGVSLWSQYARSDATGSHGHTGFHSLQDNWWQQQERSYA